MTNKKAVRNPRTGAVDFEIACAGEREIAALALQLRDAQPGWQAMGVQGRVDVLQAFKAGLLTHQSDIIAALSADTGRLALAKGELFGLVGSIDRWCQLAPDLMSTAERPSAAMPDVALDEVLQPYPLLGAISPWNFPLLLSFIDVVPALLAGCAAIIKPSEVTPRFASPLAEVIAGVPALQRVLRFVTGDGSTGAALIPAVDVVAFTGSVATGRKVAAAAASAFIPAFLELGGKDPAIVLAGSDIDRASTAIVRASVAATGQACQSLERVYVHDSLHDAFIDALTVKAQAVPLSYPEPTEGIVGPLIFAQQAEVIRRHLDDAKAKGAIVHCGGEVLQQGGGYWVAPTVLGNVNHEMLVMTEESFGPLMPVMSFDDVDTAVALANDSVYGLSAAVFGATEAEAKAVAAQLNAGGISINDAGMTTMVFEAAKSAFGLSGMGPSRMGPSGLTRFLRLKALYVNRGDTVPIEAFKEES
ncbi:MAG: aldehyde dehydrogenase family protein [Pseudomonadota bacterium]